MQVKFGIVVVARLSGNRNRNFILSNACNCWVCPDCTACFAFLSPLVKDTTDLQICSPLALILSKYVAQSSIFYFAVDPGQGEGCSTSRAEVCTFQWSTQRKTANLLTAF